MIAIFGMITANDSATAKEREKQANEQKELEREYKEKISQIQPDYVFGDQNGFFYIKNNFLIVNDEKYDITDSFYTFGSDDTILIVLTHDKKCRRITVNYPNEKDKIINALIKCKVREIKFWFTFISNNDLDNELAFKSESEIAYFTDDTKWFRICGQKDVNMRWKVVDIDFTPQFVSDYDVETTTSENGYIGGNLGAAAIGGIIAGTTGAVAGASMRRKTQNTTTTHSVNSAKVREMPATAILTIEDKNGKRTKVSNKWYEEDITTLKTNYLVDKPVKDEKKSIVNEIEKLQALLDGGIITEDEFIEGKRKILEV